MKSHLKTIKNNMVSTKTRNEIIQPISVNVESEKINDSVESICESLSQSKICFECESVQSLKSQAENENDSRIAEGDLTLEASHVFTRTNKSTSNLETNAEFETNVESDGNWLSSNFFEAGIEPISEIFSQSFQLDDNDITIVPDIRDEKVTSRTRSCTYGIELPGETVESTPKYKNYLVLNHEENGAVSNEEVSNEDLSTNDSFVLPSTTAFTLPEEPPLPFCYCRAASIDRVSKKENINKDRKYYVCATDKCKVSIL